MLRMSLKPPGEIVVETALIWANGYLFKIGKASSQGGLEFVNGEFTVANLTVQGAYVISAGAPQPESGVFLRFRDSVKRSYGAFPCPVGAFNAETGR